MAKRLEQQESAQETIFKELNPDEDPEITEIESLCLHCQKNGITKLLLTKIPFYKEVVIMSFECSHCHWENNELQPASKIQEKGVLFQLKVQSSRDLARVVVKTEWASIVIPELDFEIPHKSQEGTVTTVEGVIERAHSGISSKLPIIKEKDPESVLKLEDFLNKLADYRSGNNPFTFSGMLQETVLLKISVSDPHLEVSSFERTNEENLMIGIYNSDSVNTDQENESEDQVNLEDEVLGIPTNCPACNAPCVTHMKLTLSKIPHFKDVVIMATNCDVCGHKTSEVKSGSGIRPLGVRCILKIESLQDLKRDLVKSDTCCIRIDELELVVGSYAFGSRYTTVEGILTVIKEQLKDYNPFVGGDSADPQIKKNMELFFEKIDEIIVGKRKVTFILDDPCGNSFIESINSPIPDSNLTVEKYERSEEQKEELGLLDMKVENYEET